MAGLERQEKECARRKDEFDLKKAEEAREEDGAPSQNTCIPIRILGKATEHKTMFSI